MSKHEHDLVSLLLFVFGVFVIILILFIYFYKIPNILPPKMTNFHNKSFFAGKDENLNVNLYVGPVDGYLEKHLQEVWFSNITFKYSLSPEGIISPDSAPNFKFCVNSDKQIYISSIDTPVIFTYTDGNLMDKSGNIICTGPTGTNNGSWIYLVQQSLIFKNNWNAITIQ
jgi:hypothetical protein